MVGQTDGCWVDKMGARLVGCWVWKLVVLMEEMLVEQKVGELGPSLAVNLVVKTASHLVGRMVSNLVAQKALWWVVWKDDWRAGCWA